MMMMGDGRVEGGASSRSACHGRSISSFGSHSTARRNRQSAEAAAAGALMPHSVQDVRETAGWPERHWAAMAVTPEVGQVPTSRHLTLAFTSQPYSQHLRYSLTQDARDRYIYTEPMSFRSYIAHMGINLLRYLNIALLPAVALPRAHVHPSGPRLCVHSFSNPASRSSCPVGSIGRPCMGKGQNR